MSIVLINNMTYPKLRYAKVNYKSNNCNVCKFL